MITKEIRLYEDREDVTLTAYIVADKGDLRKQGKRPAVLVCPGGAYLSCADQEAEPAALRFAAMGYHAFVLRYSVYSKGSELVMDFSKVKEPKPECQHPMPVREIGMVFLEIRRHAQEWMIDTDRIAVSGFSAGAHNAAMYGVYWDKPEITDFLKADKEELRPAALLLGYAPTDYTIDMKCIDPMLQQAYFTSLLGTPEPDQNTLLRVSPARLATSAVPPTYLWATSEDVMVPVQHSLRMAAALAEHGVPFELHIFEKGPHGLSLSTQATAQARSQIDPDVAKWVEMAECWLEKRFALKLPERTIFEEMFSKDL